MISVDDVAVWFMHNNKDLNKNSTSFDQRAKLQKLVYYVQSMAMVILGEPMFDEKIEAWENGPVVSRIWHENKYNEYKKSEEKSIPEEYKPILNAINGHYGFMTGETLIKLTHSEKPWKDNEELTYVRLNPEITREAMSEYYSNSMPEIYNAFSEYNSAEEDYELINGNVFVYNPSETNLTDDDKEKLFTIKTIEAQNASFFVYKENDELVVY